MHWNEQDYTRLTSLIFEAALDSSKWSAFLDDLSKVSGEVPTHIFGHDFTSNSAIDLVSTHYDPDFIKTFQEYYNRFNPWVPGFKRAQVGVATYVEEMVDIDDLVKTEFYNDWVKPQEDIIGGAGAILYKDAEHLIAIGANIRAKDKDDLEQPFVDLLTALSPQLVHAISVNRALAGLTSQKRMLSEIAGIATTAAIVVGADGQILFASDQAQEMVKSGAIVGHTVSGTLSFSDANAQARLEAALQSLIWRDMNVSASFPIEVPDGKSCSCTFSRLELQGNRLRFLGYSTGSLDNCLMITLSFSSQHTDISAVLVAKYQLTEAETGIVLDIADGLTQAQIARSRDVSIHTVRNQLKTARAKMDAHRQADVVRIVVELRQGQDEQNG